MWQWQKDFIQLSFFSRQDKEGKMGKNYYDTLGIDRQSTDDEIKQHIGDVVTITRPTDYANDDSNDPA